MPETLRQASTPANVSLDDAASISTMLLDRLAADPDGVYAEVKTDDGWRAVTVAEFAADIDATAKGLIGAGVAVGDRVAVLASTSYEWTVVDFAILAAGAVSVPVYPSSSRSQLEWIIEDAGVGLLIADGHEHAAVAEGLVHRLLVLDDGALAELARDGARIDDATLTARRTAASADDLATIVYTSGTTGRPKGVELTHRNFVEHAMNGADDPHLGPVVSGGDKRVLLFLPLSHVFGRFIAYICVYCRSVIGFTADTKTLVADLQSFRPTWLLAVPRVFETFYNTADTTAGSRLKQRIFRWSASVAREMSHAKEAGVIGAGLKARFAIADRLVLQRIRAVMGGRVEYAISGSAPLSERVGRFFHGVGILVMEGYGATELAAPTTVNLPGRIRIGSVGAPYPGTAVRLADDGEVLVQGPNVFRGYRNNPEATAASFVDGWYATGDTGTLDDAGYLTITGRKKEILITAGGKNVQPAVLENSIRSHPLVQEVVAIGDGEPFIAALISLDPAMLPNWLASKGLEDLPPAAAATDERVRTELQKAIDVANQKVSRAESIREFRILPRELTEADGELSAALKVRRAAVLEHFADQVASIYAGKHDTH